jgi:diketogulonate reductase-like aldo/keto reductase
MLTIVQRGNIPIPKSSSESRIKSNIDLFELDQADFDIIEGIAMKEGQKRFCDLDDLWGSSLFRGEVL